MFSIFKKSITWQLARTSIFLSSKLYFVESFRYMGSSIKYLRKIFRKTNISNPLIRTRTGFFSIWIFFHEHSRLIGQQWNGDAISLSSLYHFHPLHRHLDISRTITAESSPLHITSSRTWTRKLWFQSASR